LGETDSKVLEPPDWLGEMGATWREHIDVFESMIAPAGEAAVAFAAVEPGEHVLDIGCGGGPTTFELARRVLPGGRVVGLDLAPGLIEVANARLASLPLENVEFVAADATTVDLGEGRFDCLFSRFGVMFFDDPIKAFSNLRRMLAPGGRGAFAVWGPPAENPWIRDLMQVASEFIEIPKPDLTLPGMFAFSDEARVTETLGQAGFSRVEFTVWHGNQYVGGAGATPDQAAAFAMKATPIADLTAEAEPALVERIRSALAASLSAHATPEGIPRPGTVRLVSAFP